MNGGDVAVVQGREKAGLALEAGAADWVFGALLRQDLNGDAAA
jgi:hypothetical protein